MCRQKQSLMDMPHQKPWISLTHFVKLYPTAFKPYFNCFSPKQTKLKFYLIKSAVHQNYLFEWVVTITLLCPTLCDPMDYTVHGILQARILEWVAVPFSEASSQHRGQTQVSHIAGRFFTSWVTRKAQFYCLCFPLDSKLHEGRIHGGLAHCLNLSAQHTAWHMSPNVSWREWWLNERMKITLLSTYLDDSLLECSSFIHLFYSFI